MRDGVRWPNRGIIAWMNTHGVGVEIASTENSCSLVIPTSEQLMAFRFKFENNRNTDKRLRLKHFAITEQEWANSAPERSLLSASREISVFYSLRFRTDHNRWYIAGPTMSKHHVDKWTLTNLNVMDVVKKNFIGDNSFGTNDVTTALEIINELRLIWVNAPVMLRTQKERSLDLINITDQDPLFVALMK
jgi:hypothetical protein